MARRASLGRLVLLLVLCSARAQSEEAQTDAPLKQAQKELDEARRLGHAGRYPEALPLAEHALLLRERELGPNHPDVAECLDWIGVLHSRQGGFAAAEAMYLRALRIREATQGRSHPAVAMSLGNLADLYRDQGSYDRAESLYRRTLELLEENLGKDHPAVAAVLNNLAVLYRAQGTFDRAQSLYQRALSIRAAALEPHPPDVAASLTGLATIYRDQGAYDRAEPLYRRALQIQETTLGPNHPDVAASLTSLGTLYRDQGAYDRAEPLYRRALQIQEATLGQHHPDLGVSLENFALLNVARNRLDMSVPLFERAFSISEECLRRGSYDLSSGRLMGLLDLLRQKDAILYEALREHPSDPGLRRLGLSATLLHKGRSADEIAGASWVLHHSLTEADREAFRHLQVVRSKLANLSLEGPGRLSPASYQVRLKELEAQSEAIEVELARRSSNVRALRQLPAPSEVISRVAAALPSDGALIEIVAFAAHSLVPPPGTPLSRLPRIPTYLALVLLPDGGIGVADLGPADPIDAAVRRVQSALSHREGTYLAAAQELYRLVFQSIAPLVGAQRQLFISPDGLLNLVPFAVLHDGARFLTDTYDLAYLDSSRDLLRRDEDMTPSNSVVVFADPDFSVSGSASETRGSLISTSQGAGPARPAGDEKRSFARERSGVTHLLWELLPGTRKEAAAIRKLFPQAQLMLGAAATKQALLEVKAPGILHVATHGVFLGDSVSPPATRGLVSTADMPEQKPRSLPSDPLLRSALILSRSRAPAGIVAAAHCNPEGSLATALEISGMNLWGTQLVVLSACDSGRGEVKLGQGVYGLQRAFLVAGAETVVTSLWKVNDQVTHELMEGYYRRLLAGQGRAHALREAMAAMRARHSHPYYWAPFIVVGNGAPLRGFGVSTPAKPQGTRPPS